MVVESLSKQLTNFCGLFTIH